MPNSKNKIGFSIPGISTGLNSDIAPMVNIGDVLIGPKELFVGYAGQSDPLLSVSDSNSDGDNTAPASHYGYMIGKSEMATFSIANVVGHLLRLRQDLKCAAGDIPLGDRESYVGLGEGVTAASSAGVTRSTSQADRDKFVAAGEKLIKWILEGLEEDRPTDSLVFNQAIGSIEQENVSNYRATIIAPPINTAEAAAGEAILSRLLSIKVNVPATELSTAGPNCNNPAMRLILGVRNCQDVGKRCATFMYEARGVARVFYSAMSDGSRDIAERAHPASSPEWDGLRDIPCFGGAPHDGRRFIDVSNEQGNRSFDAACIGAHTQLWNLAMLLLSLIAWFIASIVWLCTFSRVKCERTHNFIVGNRGYRADWIKDEHLYEGGQEDVLDNIKSKMADGCESFSVFMGHAWWLHFVRVPSQDMDGKYRYVCMSHDRVGGNLSALFYRSQTREALSAEQFASLFKGEWSNNLCVEKTSHVHRDHIPPNYLLGSDVNHIIVAPRGATDLIKEYMLSGSKAAVVIESDWGVSRTVSALMHDGGQQPALAPERVCQLITEPNAHWSQYVLTDTARYSSESQFTIFNYRCSPNGSVCSADYIVKGSSSSESIFVEEGCVVDGVEFVLGDTAMPPDAMVHRYATNLASIIQTAAHQKKGVSINMVLPCGPNKHRKHMKSTHMSCVDSLMLAMKIATTTSSILEVRDFKRVLGSFSVNLYHHNKYKLGNDKMNEWYYLLRDMQAFATALRSEELSTVAAAARAVYENLREGNVAVDVNDAERAAYVTDHVVRHCARRIFADCDDFVCAGFVEIARHIIRHECECAERVGDALKSPLALLKVVADTLDLCGSEVFCVPKIGTIKVHGERLSGLSMYECIQELDLASGYRGEIGTLVEDSYTVPGAAGVGVLAA